MVPCTHTVVVCVDRGGGGGPLINMGPESCFPVLFLGQLIHTVVACSHRVVVCVDGGGGDP